MLMLTIDSKTFAIVEDVTGNRYNLLATFFSSGRQCCKIV